jgi:hypothetical protein
MRYVSFVKDGKSLIGVREGIDIRVIGEVSLESLLAQGVDLATYGLLPRRRALDRPLRAQRALAR